ncbi:MAG: hypothetical protein Q8L98_05560 [Chlamydiales bacterium]|nr:hypothetical protein [Chlamydiales bacterium]
MSIDINLLNFSAQLVDLNKMLSEARAENTYLEGRIVTFKGSSISLDALVKKVTAVARENLETAHLTPAEMVAGLDITRKLKQFYRDTDKSAGIIIKLCNWLREFPLFSSATRFTLDEDKFRGFSATQFSLYLGSSWPLHEHPAFDGKITDDVHAPQKPVKEEWIRALATGSASDNQQLVENLKLARSILVKYKNESPNEAEEPYVRGICSDVEFAQDPIKFLISEMIERGFSSDEGLESCDFPRAFIIGQIPSFGEKASSKDYLRSIAEERFKEAPNKQEIMECFLGSLESKGVTDALARGLEQFEKGTLGMFKFADDLWREAFLIFPGAERV